MMVMTWSTTSWGRSIYTIMIIYIDRSIDYIGLTTNTPSLYLFIYNICRHRVQEPYRDQALHGLLTVRRTEELI